MWFMTGIWKVTCSVRHVIVMKTCHLPPKLTIHLHLLLYLLKTGIWDVKMVYNLKGQYNNRIIFLYTKLT